MNPEPGKLFKAASLHVDQGKSAETDSLAPSDSQYTLYESASHEQMQDPHLPVTTNSQTSSDKQDSDMSARIVPAGIRSRWENSETAKLQSGREAARSGNAEAKSPKKGLAMILLISVTVIFLSFITAAISVIDSGQTLVVIANELSGVDRGAALVLYNEGVRTSPDWPNSYMNRGQNYFEMNRFAEALADFNKAIQLKPDYALALRNRGMLYKAQKQYPAAIRDLTKAIEFNGKNGNPFRDFYWFDRGWIYVDSNDWLHAISDFTASVKQGHADEWTYNNRGFALAQLNRHREAIEDYKKALAIDPKNEKALVNLEVSEQALKSSTVKSP